MLECRIRGIWTDLNAYGPFCSHYLLANGVALLAISQHPRFGNAKTTRGFAKYAGALIGTGAVLFSGSIFLLLLNRPR